MLRRFAATTLALTATLGLAACGEDHEVTKGESEAFYVTVDDLKYQVQISRVLNPADPEDQAYVEAVDPAEAELEGEEAWFALFLRVENESDNAVRSASDIVIEDTTGAEFEPVRMDRDRTPLAYVPRVLEPGDENPAVGSVAQTTSTAGALVLYKIPRQNLENRPLEVKIHGGVSGKEATVDLDV
ncbi:MAG TPA: hypothetical protein VD931_07305 [Baekduia sp.]|nr:hypothetical protein [Baekduia sp.]